MPPPRIKQLWSVQSENINRPASSVGLTDGVLQSEPNVRARIIRTSRIDQQRTLPGDVVVVRTARAVWSAKGNRSFLPLLLQIGQHRYRFSHE